MHNFGMSERFEPFSRCKNFKFDYYRVSTESQNQRIKNSQIVFLFN